MKTENGIIKCHDLSSRNRYLNRPLSIRKLHLLCLSSLSNRSHKGICSSVTASLLQIDAVIKLFVDPTIEWIFMNSTNSSTSDSISSFIKQLYYTSRSYLFNYNCNINKLALNTYYVLSK